MGKINAKPKQKTPKGAILLMVFGMLAGLVVGYYYFDDIASGGIVGMCGGMIIGLLFEMKDKNKNNKENEKNED